MDKKESSKLYSSLFWAGGVSFLLVVVHLLINLTGTDPGFFGVFPRELRGLTGILTSPFVHGDWSHLLSNLAPIFVFTAALVYFYRPIALRAALWIFLMTNVWVWVAARSSSHIGASGMLYGLAAFIFFSGIFRRNTRAIALSLIIGFFYGSLIWGVLPIQEGVSWESHLFGGLAGLSVAWYLRKTALMPKRKYRWEDEPEESPEDANALWNYPKNWQGAKQIYIPGDEHWSNDQ